MSIWSVSLEKSGGFLSLITKSFSLELEAVEATAAGGVHRDMSALCLITNKIHFRSLLNVSHLFWRAYQTTLCTQSSYLSLKMKNKQKLKSAYKYSGKVAAVTNSQDDLCYDGWYIELMRSIRHVYTARSFATRSKIIFICKWLLFAHLWKLKWPS